MFQRLHIHVLHTVPFFGALAVVEAFQTAHEVAGDSADTLEVDALPDMLHFLLHIRPTKPRQRFYELP